MFSVSLSLSAQYVSGDDLEIKIAIAGPGDELYFWWGHIALVICNTRTNENNFYDYGVFSYKNADFYYNFAFGRMYYTSVRSSMESNIENYINNNRDISLYSLDLSPREKEIIYWEAEKSILPEFRDYQYHFFYHNCTTRLLNIIDAAIDGQIEKYFTNQSGRFTFRQHVRRHSWFSPFFDWILNFWMGQDIDAAIPVWGELFLPSEVGRQFVNFQYIDSDGNLRNIVSNVETLNHSVGRPIVLDAPRTQWIIELVFSLILAAFLGFLFFIQVKFPAAGQVLLGITHSLLGLFFGTASLVLYFLSIFTSHDYTYHNINMIFCTPLLLAAFPLGIRYAVSKNYYRRIKTEFLLRLLWLLTVIGIFISMLIKLSPSYWQDNLTDQMLMLPIALVLSLEPFGMKRLLYRIFWRFL